MAQATGVHALPDAGGRDLDRSSTADHTVPERVERLPILPGAELMAVVSNMIRA